MTFWTPGHRICVSAQYCPAWGTPVFFVSENGGRHPGECLDLNAAFWRLRFGLTLYGLRRLSRLLRFLPDHPSGRGYEFGWRPGRGKAGTHQ